MRDLDVIAGSHGVRGRRSVGFEPGHLEETCDALPETVFVPGGIARRQVTGRNAPTVINAVFDIRTFCDGRSRGAGPGGELGGKGARAGPRHA